MTVHKITLWSEKLQPKYFFVEMIIMECKEPKHNEMAMHNVNRYEVRRSSKLSYYEYYNLPGY